MIEWTETGLGAAVGCFVGVGVGPGVAAGSGVGLVSAEGLPLPVWVAPGDGTMPSICPASDMAAHPPSEAWVVALVALVVTGAVLVVEAVFGVALTHERYLDLGRREGS